MLWRSQHSHNPTLPFNGRHAQLDVTLFLWSAKRRLPASISLPAGAGGAASAGAGATSATTSTGQEGKASVGRGAARRRLAAAGETQAEAEGGREGGDGSGGGGARGFLGARARRALLRLLDGVGRAGAGARKGGRGGGRQRRRPLLGQLILLSAADPLMDVNDVRDEGDPKVVPRVRPVQASRESRVGVVRGRSGSFGVAFAWRGVWKARERC